jgi:aspartyl-tRNA(Asn)/glutamyl-tRNA(Gln) amidotransferase subunit B
VTYEAVIGLEVHAQLKTATKMFCACPAAFEAPPNSCVCPVCLGHPGALPVANRRAAELAVRLGLAVGATVRAHSSWARKNYFYPDLPKGYQITQYAEPIVTGGALEIETTEGSRSIRLVRMHLEEDAGRSQHPERSGERTTRVDLNRCGTPLLEIVSAPDLRTPEEARAYLVRLKQILQYCAVSDADMEKGGLRCDVNISVRPAGEERLGTPAELKNLNSFRHVERALAAEITRQVARLRRGETVSRETRLWDPAGGRTHAMRDKEAEHDYRYFPEPDLPPLILDPDWIAAIERSLPEMPDRRRARLVTQYGIRPYDARLLTATRELADYFEAVAARAPDAQIAANLVGSELLGLLHEQKLEVTACPIRPQALADLAGLRAKGTLSSKLIKQVLAEMLASGEGPEAIIRSRGWVQVEDGTQLRAWVIALLETHPQEVADYRKGKTALLEFFMGQLMMRSQGRAHPEKARALLEELLGAKP